MKTIYVRIAKKGVETFHRCGEKFTGAWRLLEGVDDATLQRLREEQMLEVSDTKPEGFEPTAEDGAALQPAASASDLSDVEREILTIVGNQLSLTKLDDVFGAFEGHLALVRRDDAEKLQAAYLEVERLSALLDQSLIEAGKLAEENTRLQAQLAALDTPATAAAPVEGPASQEGNVEAAPAPDADTPTEEAQATKKARK